MRGRLIFVLFLMVALVTVGGYQANSYAAPTKDGAAGSISVSVKDPQPIAPTAYGQNYWSWVPDWGDPVQGTEDQFKALKLNVLRAGGYNNDAETPAPWNEAEVDKYIAYCRAIDAEPIFQVSVIKGDSAAAANWVNYCNKVKGYNVKYWIIGNEPDLYAGKDKRAAYNVQSYIADFKAYAAAMKAVDNTIKVMGPELSWKYQLGNGSNDWFTPFMKACHDDVDIVTFHRYPGDANFATIQNAMADKSRLRSIIRSLRTVVNQYAGPDKPLAITETNITYDGDPTKSTQSASPQTFYVSLWVADSMGVALEENLWTNAYWSISEGFTMGFLNDRKQPKPIYYGLSMFTNHFEKLLIRPTSVPAGLSVYASRDAANTKTILMVINKTKQNLAETIQINDLAQPVTKQHTFPSFSITCIAIPDDGSPSDLWTYQKTPGEPVHTTE